jgi:hypothetical protein
MSSIYHYRVYCCTEEVYAYVWSATPPTVCPNNNQHQIDSASITIIDSREQNNVSIVQVQPGTTGEHYRVESLYITIPPNSIFTKDLTWPFNISVMTINFSVGIEHEGDILNGYIAPNTTIGVITDMISQGDTTLHVNSTVLSNLKVGFLVNVTNGSQNMDLGQCVNVDLVNSTVTCEFPATTSINVGAYLQMTINNIRNMILGEPDTIRLANKHVNSSLLPKGKIARFVYQNNSAEEKKFMFYYEILY